MKVNGETKIVGIYKITNTTNNKCYIGSSSFVQARIRLHKSHLKKNIHTNKHLQSSYNKYGSELFIYEIIEECSIEDLITREQFWIDILEVCNNKKGYNKRLQAENNVGLKRSEETKRKISESKKGKRYLSDKHYEKLSNLKKGKPNEAAKKFQDSLNKEEKSKRSKIANSIRIEKAEERGDYFTKEGRESYKKKRGRKVYKYDLNYDLVEKYNCIADALRNLGMSPKNTSCIKNQIDTGKIYKNYIWSSVDLTNSNISTESGELLETPEVDNQQPS